MASIVSASVIAFSTLLLTSASAREDAPAFLSQTPYAIDASSEDYARLAHTFPEFAKKLLAMSTSEISYKSDGLIVKGYLAVPKVDGRFPVIIMNRGGSRDNGAWTHFSFGLNSAALVDAGYIVIASQYRGNGGSEGHEEFGGADIDDVLNLIPLLPTIPKADASRIGMWGASRGGMMTFKALTKTQSIRAAVVASSLTNMLAPNTRKDRVELENNFRALIPGYDTNRTAVLRERSPIFWADKLNKTTPILMIAGTGDWRADASTQAIAMADALYKARQPFRFVLFEGADHGLHEFPDEVDRITIAWFHDYLRDGKKWPSLEPHDFTF